MNDTIFTKIINKEIPAHIVYEDDMVLAFLDIKPINHGHTLVIPKKPFINIFDGDPETLAYMIKISQKLSQTLKNSGLADGVNIIINNGEVAGQEVFHSHIHIVPRLLGDNAFQTPKHIENPEEKFKEISELIKKTLV